MDMPSCDVLNNPNREDLDPEDPDKRETVNYY